MHDWKENNFFLFLISFNNINSCNQGGNALHRDFEHMPLFIYAVHTIFTKLGFAMSLKV